MSRKPVVPSCVDTPVTTKVISSASLSTEQAERMLTEFLGSQEERVSREQTSADSTSLSQLKRIQRDLRGLPSLIE